MVFDSGRIADRFHRARADGGGPGVRRHGRRHRSRALRTRRAGSRSRATTAARGTARSEQITPRNVRSAHAPWTFQSGTYARGRGFETTPLALDGVLYVTGPNGYAWAIDARTGRPFWEYRRTLAGRSHVRRQRAREPGLRHLGRAAVPGLAGRALDWRSIGAPASCSGTSSSRTIASATRRHWRRSSSTTRSSSASRAANIRRAASSMPTIPRPARRSGASTPCPHPASPAATPGRARRARRAVAAGRG